MNSRLAALLLLLYAGTGVTALAYEVLWTRMLSLMFGVSIFGVIITVTAFMMGLGSGSLFFSRLRWSPARALTLLAVLEAAIALYALAMPMLMPGLDALLIHWGGSFSLTNWQVLQAVAALLVLLIPAFAMGSAFPLALRAAGSIGVGLGPLYGVNAIGGAIGAALPLLLLPWLGWAASLRLVAMIGIGFALIAFILSRSLSQSGPHLEVETKYKFTPSALDLLAYAGVGAAALILEMVWTRMYGMVLLRTEYILAVLLLIYLAGIGLGSVMSRYMRSHNWLKLLPIIASVLAVASLYLLPWISRWAHDALFDSLVKAMFWQGVVVAVCTLPVTLVLGAWLPLLVRGADDQSQAGGWWYGVNSAGAALGALLAGFVLLPLFGTAGSLILAAFLLLICGLRWSEWRMIGGAGVLLALIAMPLLTLPPATALLPSLNGARDLSVREDVVSVTHVVEQADGQRLLLSDLQRMDASSEATAVTVQKNQARLPLLLHPDPKSVLFLGLGTGITASGSLPFGELSRRAVELSAGSIHAAGEYFSEVNGGITGVMDVVHDDARRFIRADRHQYDVIVGDLFHPDMVGRANLLSLQQFRRAKARLNEGGIFVQWLALNQFDVSALKVVMHTFATVFDGAALFVDGYRIALVGVNHGGLSANAAMQHWQRLDQSMQQQASGREGLWSWLGRFWGKIPDFRDSSIQDEWSPVIEYALPKVRYAGGVNAAENWHWLMSWRDKAEHAMQVLDVPATHQLEFRRAWAGTEANVHLWLAELAGDDRQAVYWARLGHRANELDRWSAFALADRMFDSLAHGGATSLDRVSALKKILELRPDHEGALEKLMLLYKATGDVRQSELYRQKLQQVSPLARVLRNE